MTVIIPSPADLQLPANARTRVALDEGALKQVSAEVEAIRLAHATRLAALGAISSERMYSSTITGHTGALPKGIMDWLNHLTAPFSTPEQGRSNGGGRGR